MHIGEVFCMVTVIVGLLTFCIGVFIQTAEVRGSIQPPKKDSGLIMSLLGILIIILGIFALTGYRSGLQDGYKWGQTDALHGVWQYERQFRIKPPVIEEKIMEK